MKRDRNDKPPAPLTVEESRLIRRIAGRKPSAAMHLLEYVLERVEAGTTGEPGPECPGAKPAEPEPWTPKVGERVRVDGLLFSDGHGVVLDDPDKNGFVSVRFDEDRSQGRPHVSNLKPAPIVSPSEVTSIIPPPLTRTIRVPAIGQRVRNRQGSEEVIAGYYLGLLVGKPATLCHPDAVTPIGPEPYRWITIELPEPPEAPPR